MRSKVASGCSKVVVGPWRPPLLETPCWGWLIVVLTVTVFLPAAADRCSPSNPSCDESTFPFFDNTFKEKVKADATRVLKESDQPTLKVPLGLCNHSAS